jgi:phosphate starvation-inducible PhoH-like protein
MNFPKTPGQCKYMLALRSPKPIVIGTGPAGSGKTLLACQVALEHVSKIQRPNIVLTRPIVTVDEDMGYLPGDMDQKMEPWTKPMYEIFGQFFNRNQMDRFITVEPLGYMRGRTFNNTLIIADEMQNATPNQLKMLLTRVGEGTKLIITGDLGQSDLGPENGLRDLVYKMQCQDLEYIRHVEMGDEDIVRHPAVKEVLRILNV